MSSGSSSSSNKLRAMIQLFSLYRSRNPSSNPSHGHGSSAALAKRPSIYSVHQGLRSISTDRRGFRREKDGKKKVELATVPAASGWCIFPNWAKIVVGSIISLLVPFLKWGKLKRIEGEAEMVVGEVEKVANVVEKVATVTVKISDDMANILPDKSKLKDAALLVEHIAKVTVEDVELAEHFIHKVGVLKEDVEELERIVEPVIHNMSTKKESGGK